VTRQVKYIYDDGSNPTRATQVARSADVAVLVVGYTSADEGEYVAPEAMIELAKLYPTPNEQQMQIVNSIMSGVELSTMPPGGDRKSLTLHPEDEALILAVVAANQKTVVAMMGGSAIITESWRAKVPAILMLWYPGMEGGRAFADILLGRVNPSGKLPCVFATRLEDLPYYDMNARNITYDMWHGYRKLERDGVIPAFPYGFGLSYTTFSFANLRLDQDELTEKSTLSATLDITTPAQWQAFACAVL
jgi:beta-glucosidase